MNITENARKMSLGVFGFYQAVTGESNFLHNIVEQLYVPLMTITVNSKCRSVLLICG